MPPGNRRLQRSTRVSPPAPPAAPVPSSSEYVKCNFSPNTGASLSTLGYELPFAPRHIPFPNIPYDGDLLFESMMFVFTALAAGSQFLNLYRTVWWLPHSYTSQTMVSLLLYQYIQHYSYYLTITKYTRIEHQFNIQSLVILVWFVLLLRWLSDK